jgi:hypothetical protein
MKDLYTATFPVGSKVQIADRALLLNFMATWKYHHKLLLEQLEYADAVGKVEKVGFYHGGDLYNLEGIPGIWHEECLRPT